nr:hypothetical protein [Rubripirellula sp.]
MHGALYLEHLSMSTMRTQRCEPNDANPTMRTQRYGNSINDSRFRKKY